MAQTKKREQAKEWCIVLQKQDYENGKELETIDLVNKLNSLSLPFYATILHDLFSEIEKNEKEHYHLIIQFDKVFEKSTILTMLTKGLGVNEKTISIEKCSSIKSQARYLIHKDNPEKHQFNPSEIFTNNPLKVSEYLQDYQEPTTNLLMEWLDTSASKKELLGIIGLKNYQSISSVINGLVATHSYETHIKQLEYEIQARDILIAKLNAKIEELETTLMILPTRQQNTLK